MTAKTGGPLPSRTMTPSPITHQMARHEALAEDAKARLEQERNADRAVGAPAILIGSSLKLYPPIKPPINLFGRPAQPSLHPAPHVLWVQGPTVSLCYAPTPASTSTQPRRTKPMRTTHSLSLSSPLIFEIQARRPVHRILSSYCRSTRPPPVLQLNG